MSKYSKRKVEKTKLSNKSKKQIGGGSSSGEPRRAPGFLVPPEATIKGATRVR